MKSLRKHPLDFSEHASYISGVGKENSEMTKKHSDTNTIRARASEELIRVANDRLPPAVFASLMAETADDEDEANARIADILGI